MSCRQDEHFLAALDILCAMIRHNGPAHEPKYAADQAASQAAYLYDAVRAYYYPTPEPNNSEATAQAR